MPFTLRIPRQFRIHEPVSAFRNVPDIIGAAPNDVPPPECIRERAIDLHGLAGSDDNVVRKREILRAEPASATLQHHQAFFIIDQRVENHLDVIGTIMCGQFGGRDDAIAIADVDGARAFLEIIAENFVIMAKDANTFAAEEKVGVNDIGVAMAQGQFTATLAESVKAIGILAGFVADVFIFAVAMQEQIGFHQRVSGRHAPPTDADLNGGAVVLVGIAKVVEKIVVNPRALRHLVRARTVNDDHLALCKFILERVMIDFSIIAADHQVMSAAGELEGATSIAAVVRAGGNFFSADKCVFLPDSVSEFETFDDDPCGGWFEVETVRAGDFRPADTFGANRDGPLRRPLARNANGIARSINAIRENNR